MNAGLSLQRLLPAALWSRIQLKLALHLCILLQRKHMYFFINPVQYSHNLSLVKEIQDKQVHKMLLDGDLGGYYYTVCIILQRVVLSFLI